MARPNATMADAEVEGQGHEQTECYNADACIQRRDVEANYLFLPRCMECRRGLAMRKLSVRLSVCLSNAWIVTKRKKDLSRLLYHFAFFTEFVRFSG